MRRICCWMSYLLKMHACCCAGRGTDKSVCAGDTLEVVRELRKKYLVLIEDTVRVHSSFLEIIVRLACAPLLFYVSRREIHVQAPIDDTLCDVLLI